MIRSCVYIGFSLLLIALTSCTEPTPQVPYNKIEKEKTSEAMMELNKEFAAIEDSLIESYLDSIQLKMETSPSGMRYHINEIGVGTKIPNSAIVTFRYTVRQLDGTTCDKMIDVVKTVDLDKCDLERGFREAIRMLKTSGSGVFVMPSFLAYGVIGVPKCIPAWTPVVCDITLIEWKKETFDK